MAHWDCTTSGVIYFSPEPWEGYPKWMQIDCGCCAGLEWGGDGPRECDTCGASGRLAKHIKTGTLALWPGGPFRGKEYKIKKEKR